MRSIAFLRVWQTAIRWKSRDLGGSTPSFTVEQESLSKVFERGRTGERIDPSIIIDQSVNMFQVKVE
jgi:hypothetical protein